MFLLLFLISCKTKFNPSEETYNGLIPKEFLGKYIPYYNNNYNYDDYYEATSSNILIHSSKYTTEKMNITTSRDTARNNMLIYLAEPGGDIYFYTNKESKRQLFTFFMVPMDANPTLIHIDDINK